MFKIIIQEPGKCHDNMHDLN